MCIRDSRSPGLRVCRTSRARWSRGWSETSSSRHSRSNHSPVVPSASATTASTRRVICAITASTFAVRRDDSTCGRRISGCFARSPRVLTNRRGCFICDGVTTRAGFARPSGTNTWLSRRSASSFGRTSHGCRAVISFESWSARATRCRSRRMSPRQVAFTIGHSTRSVEDFIALLLAHHIELVVDVRTVPRSRRNPQFNRETLPQSLQAADIGYEHVAALGGFRRPSPHSPNAGWRNASFRGYADYMQTAAFGAAIESLAERAHRQRLAVMCAEAVPWRCHRSLICLLYTSPSP